MTAHKRNCQEHIAYHSAMLAKWWTYRRDPQAGRHARWVIKDSLRHIRTWQRIADRYPE